MVSNPYAVANNCYYYDELLNKTVKIPKDLHNLFNDYAPAPEHFSPKFDDLSEFQKWMINKNLGSKPSGKDKKLMCTLNDKIEYIIDYRLLKEYMKHGVELIYIHSGIKYTQEAWLKPYIEKIQNSDNKRKRLWKRIFQVNE